MHSISRFNFQILNIKNNNKFLTRNIKTKSNKTYFEILEITYDANNNDIKNAFYSKAKILHPDVNKTFTLTTANERFIELKNAYDTLIDKKLRLRYIEKIKNTGGRSDNYYRNSSEYTNNYNNNSNTTYNENFYENSHEKSEKRYKDENEEANANFYLRQKKKKRSMENIPIFGKETEY